MHPVLVDRPALFEITRRHRRPSYEAADPLDFTYGRVRPAGLDELVSLRLSPYCIHPATGQMLFVEIPAGLDVTAGPFLYLAQHEHASRVASVPYAWLPGIRHRVESERLVFVFSIGRCGSTLLSRMLQRVEEVRSLSEPDIYFQVSKDLVPRGRFYNVPDIVREATRLLDLFHRDRPVLAIKPRALCSNIARVVHGLYPAAVLLFMYRDIEPWARSYHRAFGVPVERLAAQWRRDAAQWRDLTESGVPFISFSYEDLTDGPLETIRAILRRCSLEERHAQAAVSALEQDSQEGLGIARDRLSGSGRELSDADIARLKSAAGRARFETRL
jgi:hypothetical protein